MDNETKRVRDCSIHDFEVASSCLLQEETWHICTHYFEPSLYNNTVLLNWHQPAWPYVTRILCVSPPTDLLATCTFVLQPTLMIMLIPVSLSMGIYFKHVRVKPDIHASNCQCFHKLLSNLCEADHMYIVPCKPLTTYFQLALMEPPCDVSTPLYQPNLLCLHLTLCTR